MSGNKLPRQIFGKTCKVCGVFSFKALCHFRLTYSLSWLHSLTSERQRMRWDLQALYLLICTCYVFSTELTHSVYMRAEQASMGLRLTLIWNPKWAPSAGCLSSHHLPLSIMLLFLPILFQMRLPKNHGGILPSSEAGKVQTNLKAKLDQALHVLKSNF